MNTTITVEKHNGDPCIMVRVKNHEMMGHESNTLYVLGSCLVEEHKVIFDFSSVQMANSYFIDSIIKIYKKDKKKHASFIFSNQLHNLIAATGLYKVIKIII